VVSVYSTGAVAEWGGLSIRMLRHYDSGERVSASSENGPEDPGGASKLKFEAVRGAEGPKGVYRIADHRHDSAS
jgi:hypothetical protein